MATGTEGQTGLNKGRMIAFYAILAVVTAVVVILVVNKGQDEKAQPIIAGGYDANAPADCLGTLPPPPSGPPLPSTAPTQPTPAGPSFIVQQSGQFVSLTNNLRTLGGKLKLHTENLPGGTRKLDGDVDCVNGGSKKLNVLVTPGTKATMKGTLGGAPFAATLKRDPPDPGAALPRTPNKIDGKYMLSPRSTCFGGKFVLDGDGPAYEVVAKNLTLGTVNYNKDNATVSGDVACTAGGKVRLKGTANDLQLQNVKLIPLDEATPVPPPAGAAPSAKPALTTPSGLPPAGEQFTATKVRESFGLLVAHFFLAVAIVLIVARLFGIAAVKIGQPRVMGEVIAGICLGPSLLGLISPNLQAAIFPTDILVPFGVAANLGLIFYMFLVGLEVDTSTLKGKAGHAAAISNASVALPMMLGIAAALPLYKLVGPDKKFVAFAIFMGVAMSITAFPVLARILTERRMLRKPVGALTIACAAIDDVTAWFLIALATAVAAAGGFGDVAKTIGEATAFVLIMVFVIRRILTRMATAYDEVGRLPGGWFAGIVVGVLVAAYVTETIHIAVIFGGFMMGMVMPRHARLSEDITRRIEDFVLTLLLPMFFVYTGLRTNIGLLDRPELWALTAVLVVIAIVGKLVGAMIAARTVGFNWKASGVIGTLMNTRGLTELIVLNLALDAGAISNALFAALVLMAVITTLMAGPLLKLIDPKNEYGSDIEEEFADAARASQPDIPGITIPERSILVAPQTDDALATLVKLAGPLAQSEPRHELIITRLVEPSRTVSAGKRVGLSSENFQLEKASRAINEARERLQEEGVAARGVALSTTDLGNDLVHIIENEKAVDLILIEGRRRLVGEGVPLGDVGTLLEKAACDAAVLISNEGAEIRLGPDRPILVPFGGAEHDWSALELGSWLASVTGTPLKLLGAAGQTDESAAVTRMLGDAGLLVQQSTGIATEPLLVENGRDGIIAASEKAGLLVIGLSDRWKSEGLGPTRSEIAKAAPAPVLFVRRGSRPGLFAPKTDATTFKWSMAGQGPEITI